METSNKFYFWILIFFLPSCFHYHESGTNCEKFLVKPNINESVLTNSRKYNYLDWYYTSRIAFYNNCYVQSNKNKTALFLYAYEYFKLKVTNNPQYTEDLLDTSFKKFFYESSSSYNLYAFFSAFMVYSDGAFLLEGVGYNISRMFIMFPDKFYEMFQYSELLNKDEQYEIWDFILTNCAWELFDLYPQKKIKPQNVIRDTIIYNNIYPNLYDNFGSSPWQFVVMNEMNVGENSHIDTKYLEYLRLKFEESINRRINYNTLSPAVMKR